MKKLIAVSFLTATFGIAAESGTAIVSHINSATFASDNALDTFIYLTNISQSHVHVQVKMFRQDGTLISDTDNNSNAGILKAYNVTSYNDNSISNSVSFGLPSGVTGRIWLDNPSALEINGYAVVEWSTGDGGNTTPSLNSLNALVGHATVYRGYKVVGYYSVPINSGNPF